MILLLIALPIRAGFDAWRIFSQNDPRVTRQDSGKDFASIIENRFSLFKAVLPEDAVVGYVTLPEMDLVESGDLWYGGAQYCLAPRVIKHSSDEEILITNFRDDAQLDRFADANGLQIQKRVGPGLAVVKNLKYQKAKTTAGPP